MNKKKLTKLDALRILASAYYYVNDIEAASVLGHAFGYVRRSLSLDDLRPKFEGIVEGFNGRMPTHF
jgi:hypothetical protein